MLSTLRCPVCVHCVQDLSGPADKAEGFSNTMGSAGPQRLWVQVCLLQLFPGSYACRGVTIVRPTGVSNIVTSSQKRCNYSGQGLGLSPELHTAIDKFIQDNKIVLFMKGNRMFPQCGFSNTCVQVRSVVYPTILMTLPTGPEPCCFSADIKHAECSIRDSQHS